MIFIKTPTEIYDKAVSYYSKIQDKVTDFTPTSIAGSLFWAFSTNLANIYEELDIVSKNSFIKTASGKYLNRLIEGTFDLRRTGDTRSYGYVTLYSASPIQNPDAFRLRCALYNRDNDEIMFQEGAETFYSPEYQQTFILTAPVNSDYVDTDEDGLPHIILRPKDNRQVYAQYFILPVVSLLKGEKSNLPEGSITSIGGNIPEIIGVLNTYSPVETISTDSEQSYAPMSTRFTNVTAMRKNEDGFTISVMNAYNFSSSGFAELVNNKGGVYTGRYRELSPETGLKIPQGRVVQESLKLEYSQAQTKYITFEVQEMPTIVKYDVFGIPTFYQLEEILDPNGIKSYKTETVLDVKNYFNHDPTNPNNKSILKPHMSSNSDPLIIRQAKIIVDRGLIFDPDSVLLDDGTIAESAWISGGSDPDDDESYRIKLKKYLASLGRSTPKALESGAMTIPGVTYAKTLQNVNAPRGSTVLLVSGDGGSLSTPDYYRVRDVLEEYWKAAGINLILKTPEKVDLTFSMSIQLDTAMNYEKSLMDSEIKKALSNYILTKKPGETLSYSEITSTLKAIPGVYNIWNLYIGKELTQENYSRLKWGYVQNRSGGEISGYYHELLEILKNSNENLKYCEFKYSPEGNPFASPTIASLYDTFSLRIPYTEGKVYAAANKTFTVKLSEHNSKDVLITEEDMKFYEERRNALVACNSPEQYLQFILDNRSELFGKISDEELASKIARLLTEPMSLVNFHINPHAVPIDYGAMPVSQLKDFVPSDEVQVAAISSIHIGKKIYPAININYVNKEVR